MATKNPEDLGSHTIIFRARVALKASLISWTSLKRNYLYWVEHLKHLS
ncbi:MAG: hypothetical protein IPO94_19935 [Saprospiraceae bacterium]|nr:hypothetical protein [Saprospiraceae bacterium]